MSTPGPYPGPPPTVPPPFGQPVYPPSPYGWPGYGPVGHPGAHPGPVPGWSAPSAPRRPGQVTAAAVLAFVQGAVVMVVSLYLFSIVAAVSALQEDPSLGRAFGDTGLPTEATVVGLLQLSSVALLVVAGIRMLIRRTPAARWLGLAAFGTQAALAVYWMARLSSFDAEGAAVWVTLCLVFAAMPVVGMLLVLVRPGRTWFRQPVAGPAPAG